jgi:hypothetical protein
MQRILILALLASSAAFAQQFPDRVFVSAGAIGGGFQKMSATPVQGAPYSATITNESVQSLADGNRITQSSTGTTARDSLGRTRQDAPLPTIGNMSPADAPHIVFIQDPVAESSYTLNLTDKTAMKGPSMMSVSGLPPGPGLAVRAGTFDAPVAIRGVAGPANTVHLQPQMIAIQKNVIAAEDGQTQTEDLGSKTMEGVLATGTRSTLTIPAGQIGNDKPLSIVTEVWTSQELKSIIYSKRSDPRMGDQTFKLTNIVRAEPDPSLFIVPADFKILDTPGPIVYKASGVPAQ